MNYQIIALFSYIVGYVLLLILSEFINRKMKVPPEYTRKLSHVAATLLAMLYPYFFKDAGYVLVLCSLFFVMLVIANRMRILPSIDKVGRETGGSYFLALGICITYFISIFLKNSMLFTLPMLILAISDPLAGLVGGKWVKSRRIIYDKTLAGSFTFLISTICICLLYFNFTHHQSIITLSLMITFATTFTELFSSRGTDNLTVPLVAAGVLIFWG